MNITLIDGHKVRMLDEQFTKGDRTFERVATYTNREGKIYYAYSVLWDKGKSYERMGGIELFKQRIVKKSQMDTHPDELFTHIEKYPNDNTFGFGAWALVDLDHLKLYEQKLFLTQIN